MSAGKTLATGVKAAASGPWGVAAALWENRGTVGKAIIAVIAICMIPVLFILMLPSLIFGGNGLDDVPANVMNDQSIITSNLTQIESGIETVLWEKHDRILQEIHTDAERLGTNHEYSITDDFSDCIIYESAWIISQFCASQDDYRQINLDHLTQTIRTEADGIFSYSVEVTSWEETDPETGDSETYYHHEYIVEYGGDAYFTDHVFHLTEEQAETAASYVSNLRLFLYDTFYQVELNPDLVPGETGNTAVDLALTKLETPYSQAKRNQEGYFDCSSFTYWVYRQLGITLSYQGSNTAAAQGRYITEHNLAISYEQLAPGDLIFYSFNVNNRYMNIDHVAIYAGDGYVVDASSSKKKVVCRPIYNTNNIVLCGRPYVSDDT